MKFQNPLLLILIPIVLLILFLAKKKNEESCIRFSNNELFAGLKETFRIKLFRNIILLRFLSLVFIILALARPQAIIEESMIFKEGIDIVLSVDVSTSMLAEDFRIDAKRQNRIEVARDVIKDFVRARNNDRIGIVAFASRPYTICPLTLDHDWLQQNLTRLEVGMIEDGTAIGSGLIVAMNKVKDTDTKEKIIILLTDGRNNAGDVPPIVAAEAAKALKIRIYTIGVGSKGAAMYPVSDPFGKITYRSVDVDIDEDTLRAIASKTGASYFRATDAEALKKIYQDIDHLEKHGIEEKIYYKHQELYHLFLITAIALLLLEFVLKNTILRKLP